LIEAFSRIFTGVNSSAPISGFETSRGSPSMSYVIPAREDAQALIKWSLLNGDQNRHELGSLVGLLGSLLQPDPVVPGIILSVPDTASRLRVVLADSVRVNFKDASVVFCDVSVNFAQHLWILEPRRIIIIRETLYHLVCAYALAVALARYTNPQSAKAEGGPLVALRVVVLTANNDEHIDLDVCMRVVFCVARGACVNC
jgi:hypothetical protein